MGWFESTDAPAAWSDPIPLVTFPLGGLYRETMFDRVERERRHWYIAFSGSSLNNVLVAVEGGLGITLLPIAATRGRHVRPYTPFTRRSRDHGFHLCLGEHRTDRGIGRSDQRRPVRTNWSSRKVVSGPRQ